MGKNVWGWGGDGDRCDGDGVGMGTDGTGMGTGVMGMGWGWEETCGDGVSMGRTSCLCAALFLTTKMTDVA